MFGTRTATRARSTVRRSGPVLGALIALLVATATPVSAATNWAPVAVSQPANTNVILNGVDVRTDNDAWAVGTGFAVAGSIAALPVYHWNGSTWTSVPTPAFTSSGGLTSVSADSATDAWAVGFLTTGYHVTSPVSLRWNGSSWSSVTVPAASRLNGVAALSPNNAWAVGKQGRFGPAAIVHWDGVAWTSVPIPHPTPAGSGLGENLLTVSARTASDIWAIGNYSSATGGPSPTFALHYDGTTWSLVPTPGSGDPQTTFLLNSVSASGVNDAWAVGQRVAAGGTPVATLIEHWNGTAWSVVNSPSIGVFPKLNGVSARAGNDVWAVGSSPLAAGGFDQAATLHWNGSTWSTVPTPAVTDYSQLSAVAARPGVASIWGVGTSRNGPLAMVRT
jgi:hypothetical protein